jgi:hypothetical protein
VGVESYVLDLQPGIAERPERVARGDLIAGLDQRRSALGCRKVDPGPGTFVLAAQRSNELAVPYS